MVDFKKVMEREVAHKASMYAVGVAAVLAAPDARDIARANTLDIFTDALAGYAQDAIVAALDLSDPVKTAWFDRYMADAPERLAGRFHQARPASHSPFNKFICEAAYHQLRLTAGQSAT